MMAESLIHSGNAKDINCLTGDVQRWPCQTTTAPHELEKLLFTPSLEETEENSGIVIWLGK
jgi:hypothetical protein